MLSSIKPVCYLCKHYDQELDGVFYCSAFPEGIPEKILSGQDDHEKPLPKQKNKIVFEKAKKEKD